MKDMRSWTRRQLCQHWRGALTGVCLGTSLAAAPAYADTFMVTNANDSGPGSLRQAILDANATPGSHLIRSDSSVEDQLLILQSPLPTIEGTMDIRVDFANTRGSRITTPITVVGNGQLSTNVQIVGLLSVTDNAHVDWRNSSIGEVANRDLTIAVLNDNSSTYLESMSVGGDIIINDNATLDWEHGSVWRQLIANDNAVVTTSFVTIINGNLVANGNSVVSFERGSVEPADHVKYAYAIIANDNAQVKFAGSESDGNIQANNNSLLWLSSNSSGNASVVGDAFANDRATLYLQGSSIDSDVTINDAAILRTSGNNSVEGTTTIGENAVFAPDLNRGELASNDVVANNATLQPWFSNADFSTAVGESNAISVLSYNTIGGSFDSKVLSPFDFAITPDSYSSGHVKLYLNSNEIDLHKLPGSENARSIGRYLSGYFNSTQTPGGDVDLTALQTSDAPAQLKELTVNSIVDASYNGNLNRLDALGWDVYAAHNAQTYWNQQSFVESIAAQLQHNPLYQSSGKSTENPLFKGFAANVSSGKSQLAALQQTLAAPVDRFAFANNNGAKNNQLWASYNGNHQSTDGNSSVGSRDWSSSSNGYTVGYTNGGNHFSWGIAAGHQESDLNLSDARGEQAGWNLGLYGSLHRKSTFVTGIIGYGKYDNDLYGADISQFDTKATSAALEIGKHLGSDSRNQFTPYASLLWTNVKQNTASNSDGFLLKDGSNNIFTTELGVRYNHRMFDKNDVPKGGWTAGLSWLHQSGDTGLPVNVGFANVDGSAAVKSTPLAGNSLRVQLGAYGRIHGNLIGFAAYQGTFGSSQKINAVNAGVGYRF